MLNSSWCTAPIFGRERSLALQLTECKGGKLIPPVWIRDRSVRTIARVLQQKPKVRALWTAYQQLPRMPLQNAGYPIEALEQSLRPLGRTLEGMRTRIDGLTIDLVHHPIRLVRKTLYHAGQQHRETDTAGDRDIMTFVHGLGIEANVRALTTCCQGVLNGRWDPSPPSLRGQYAREALSGIRLQAT